MSLTGRPGVPKATCVAFSLGGLPALLIAGRSRADVSIQGAGVTLGAVVLSTGTQPTSSREQGRALRGAGGEPPRPSARLAEWRGGGSPDRGSAWRPLRTHFLPQAEDPRVSRATGLRQPRTLTAEPLRNSRPPRKSRRGAGSAVGSAAPATRPTTASAMRIPPKAGASAAAGLRGPGRAGVPGAQAPTETPRTARHRSESSEPRAAAAAGEGALGRLARDGARGQRRSAWRALPVGCTPPPAARAPPASAPPLAAPGTAAGRAARGPLCPQGRHRNWCSPPSPSPARKPAFAPPLPSLPPSLAPGGRPPSRLRAGLLRGRGSRSHTNSPPPRSLHLGAGRGARGPARGVNCTCPPRRLWESVGGAEGVAMLLRLAKGRKLCHPAGDVRRA